MKQNLYHGGLLLFLFFLLYSSRLFASPMTGKEEKEEVNLNLMATEESLVQMEGGDLVDLIGLEECEDSKGEKCLKRRMMAEAHLDYIYTQHHKP